MSSSPLDSKQKDDVINPLSSAIEDLQMRIVFLDDLVEKLNQQVAAQNQEILQLKQQFVLLYRRVDSADLQQGLAPFDLLQDKPPHY